MKRTWLVLFSCALLLLFLACGEPEEGPDPAVLNVTITSGKTHIAFPGDIIDFTAEVQVSGSISNDVQWSIMDNSSSETAIEASSASSRMAVLVIGDDEALDQNTTITVRVESVVDPSKFDTATVTVYSETQPVEHVWMVGDATIGGWLLNLGRKLTRDNDIFTYTGMLGPGDFRFYITDDDNAPAAEMWTGYAQFIRDTSATPNPGHITGQAQPAIWVPSGSLQNATWTVPDNADFGRAIYTIIVDTATRTVTAEKAAAIDDSGSERVYLLGAFNAWSMEAANLVGSPYEMSASGLEYTWTGALTEGQEFAFVYGDALTLPTLNFSGPFFGPEDGDEATGTDGTPQEVIFKAGNAPPNFTVAESGIYTINLNINNLTASFTREGASDIEHIWITGDATIGRDNLHWSRKLTKTGNIFTYTGMLSPPSEEFDGEFRFFITNVDTPPAAGGDLNYFRLIPDPNVTGNITGQAQAAELIPVGSDAPGNWRIPDSAGFGRAVYTVTVDLVNLTVTAERASSSFSSDGSAIYAYGDATAGGWALAAGHVMDTADGIIFTGTNIALAAGDLAFTYGNTDTLTNMGWSGPFFNPPDDQLAAGTTGTLQPVEFMPDGSVRNFSITEAGTYTITLNINTLQAGFLRTGD